MFYQLCIIIIGDKAVIGDGVNTDERVMWVLVKLYLQMFSGLLLHRLGFCLVSSLIHMMYSVGIA